MNAPHPKALTAMLEPIEKQPLDAPIVEIERRWKESGIGGLYDSPSGPVCRERAINIRAFLYPKPKLPHGKLEQIDIAGKGGNLHLRIIHPLEGEVTGTLVYFHGGGWVVGDVDSHEAHAIRLANRAGVVVVNVAYRLAPEDPFPAAVEDAETALNWAHQNLARLGGVDNPLAVGGDSAGGNLAAVAALYARDNGIALTAQLLLYPATRLSGLINNPGAGGPERAYLGPNGVELVNNPRVSPACAASHAGLAPAIIGVGVYDFLYQDNMHYAALLHSAGTPVLLRQYPNLNHGFFSYTAVSKASEQAAEQLCMDLRMQMISTKR